MSSSIFYNGATDSSQNANEQFECLALLYLDGLANEQQQAEFHYLLENDVTAAVRLAQVADLHAKLRELGKSHADQPVSKTHVSTRHYRKNRPTTKRFKSTKRKKSSFPLPYAIAASLFLAVGAIAIIMATYNSHDRISILSGSITLTRNGHSNILTKSQALEPGDQLQTNGDSRATIIAADKSVINILPHSTITWRSPQNPLRITTGSVVADIMPQSIDNPFRAETTHAKVTVIGTRFVLTADENNSVLSVDHGRVRLENKSDQNSIEVGNQQLSSSTGTGVLATMAAPVHASYGLTGDYYNNMDFTNWALRRVDNDINFDWQQNPPDNRMQKGTFSIRWRGYVVPPFSGNIHFKLEIDDGARLWIADSLVIDQWGLNELVTYTGNMHLKANHPYPIRLEYFQDPTLAVIKLSWSSDGKNFQPIPSSAFRPLTWQPK